MYFLQDVFQMTAIAFVSEMNHYHINGLHLFRDTLYVHTLIFMCVYYIYTVGASGYVMVSKHDLQTSRVRLSLIG